MGFLPFCFGSLTFTPPLDLKPHPMSRSRTDFSSYNGCTSRQSNLHQPGKCATGYLLAMNCTGGHGNNDWCRARDAECYGDTIVSENIWCANNCDCHYLNPCGPQCREGSDGKDVTDGKNAEENGVVENVETVVT